MERAGTALAERVLTRLNLDENNKVLFLIGPGNNGGDGLVAARVLRERAFTDVTAYLLRQRNDDLTTAAEEAGVNIITAQQDKNGQLLQQSSYSAAIIVDALYGIGLRLPLREEVERVLRIIHSVRVERNNQQPSIYEPTLPNPIKNRPYIIAADCPSGLDVNSGEMDENILPANETVTFLTPKLGFFSNTAAPAVGTLAIASLGISEALISSHLGAWQLAHPKLVRQLLPTRTDFSDKRSNGRLLIIAGCMKYIGAVALAARAAYRSGVGILQIASPSSVRDHLPGQLLEAVWLPLPDKDVLSPESIPVVLETIASVDAIILGPGIGLADETGAFLAEVLKSDLPPLVLDADGLTLLSQLPDWPGRLPTSTVFNTTSTRVFPPEWPCS